MIQLYTASNINALTRFFKIKTLTDIQKTGYHKFYDTINKAWYCFLPESEICPAKELELFLSEWILTLHDAKINLAILSFSPTTLFVLQNLFLEDKLNKDDIGLFFVEFENGEETEPLKFTTVELTPNGNAIGPRGFFDAHLSEIERLTLSIIRKKELK